MTRGIVIAALLSGGMYWGTQSAPKSGVDLKIKKETLKSTLTELGYAPKELGNGVLEIIVPRNEEKVFVAVSLSTSMSKLWLTGNYGVLTDFEKSSPEFLLSLLEKNGEIQPAHFYVRKGKLNIGIPVDNRVATPTVLGKEIQSFADVVVRTKTFWDRTGDAYRR